MVEAGALTVTGWQLCTTLKGFYVQGVSILLPKLFYASVRHSLYSLHTSRLVSIYVHTYMIVTVYSPCCRTCNWFSFPYSLCTQQASYLPLSETCLISIAWICLPTNTNEANNSYALNFNQHLRTVKRTVVRVISWNGSSHLCSTNVLILYETNIVSTSR